ncbi:MAG: ABC transporter permease [Firmicutes bacterium]|nr:ABC transporter permease [Bacillota bacterium]
MGEGRRAAFVGPALFALTLVAWQVAAVWRRVPSWLLPTPWRVAESMWRDRALLWPSAATTLEETLLGFALAVLLGVVLAVAIHLSAAVRRLVVPWLVVSQTVPLLAFAPLLAVWFGFGLFPKVLVVFVVAFFPVVVDLADALRAVDADMVRLVRTMGASRLAVLWLVELPASLPALASGVRLTAAYAVAGAVVAEWTGATSGLGNLMIQASSQFETADAFAAIALVSALGVALYLAVGMAERLALPWARPAPAVRRAGALRVPNNDTGGRSE